MLLKTGHLRRSPNPNPLPTLDIDFTRETPLDDRLTFTRNSVASYKDRNGNWQTAAIDEPRYAYDSNGKCLGLMVEETRVNVLYDSASPATQTRTLADGRYVMWVEGTGSVTLSGGATGTATDGSPLVFEMLSTTNVTFTVSGTLNCFQCCASTAWDSELPYIFATSFIETPSGSTATRQKDHLSFNDMSWFNNSEGTLIFEHILPYQFKQTMRLWTITANDSGTVIELLYQTEPNKRAIIRNAWTTECDFLVPNPAALTPVDIPQKFIFGYKANDFAFASNGVSHGGDISGSVPTVTHAYLGGDHNDLDPFCGIISRVTYWDKRLDNDTILTLST